MKLWAGLLGRADVWQFGSAVQVQWDGAAAEGGAGGSCFSHQTDRHPEEEPRSTPAAAKQVCHTHTHLRDLFPLTWRRGFWRSLLFVRTASLLEEREEEIRSLNSDLQKKNGDISGWSSVNFTVTDSYKCVYPKYGKGRSPFIHQRCEKICVTSICLLEERFYCRQQRQMFV